MDLARAIRKRQMTRAFSDRALDGDRLDALLDLARRAPSAGNTQATRFVVLDRPALVSRYWDATLPTDEDGKRESFRWQQLLDAPVLVLVTTDHRHYLARYSEQDKAATGRGRSVERWPVPYWWVDAGAVIQNLLLLLTDAGLGALLFGPFDHEAAVKTEFGLDPEIRLVATIAIGYALPDEPGRSADRGRPDIDQVILRPGPLSPEGR